MSCLHNCVSALGLRHITGKPGSAGATGTHCMLRKNSASAAISSGIAARIDLALAIARSWWWRTERLNVEEVGKRVPNRLQHRANGFAEQPLPEVPTARLRLADCQVLRNAEVCRHQMRAWVLLQVRWRIRLRWRPPLRRYRSGWSIERCGIWCRRRWRLRPDQTSYRYEVSSCLHAAGAALYPIAGISYLRVVVTALLVVVSKCRVVPAYAFW